MHRRYGLLILLSVLTVSATVYTCVTSFYPYGLPLTVEVIGAHTGLLEPLPGVPLPVGLHAGQRLDLAAQPLPTRMAIVQSATPTTPASTPGRTYPFLVGHGATERAVAVTSIDLSTAVGALATAWLGAWLGVFTAVFTGVIALLALWRGRDRAAVGLALFTLPALLSYAIQGVPAAGVAGLLQVLAISMSFVLMGGLGLYVMAESLVGPALGARTQRRWRIGFAFLLAAAAAVEIGAPLVYVISGWAEGLRPSYGASVTAEFLLPFAMLAVSYRRVEAPVQQRLRWMLWAMGIWLAGLGLFGRVWGSVIPIVLQAAGMAGLLYVVLRHRVVDITLVLNRTLVYALTTSLVLGVFALLESLIERAALGHSANVVLELAIPLGLGVSLSTVHKSVDATVDRLIFRRQYREEVALRRFARQCAYITRAETLLDLAVAEIARHVEAPWVALYEYGAQGYARVRQHGAQALPEQVAMDDLALVKLRAQDAEVDLHSAPSALSDDGYVFPLRVRAHLQGVLVVGPRPGERYAVEERELMAHVAREVGAALLALRAQATEQERDAAQARAEAAEGLLRAARAQVEATGAREAALLEALRAPSAASKL